MARLIKNVTIEEAQKLFKNPQVQMRELFLLDIHINDVDWENGASLEEGDIFVCEKTTFIVQEGELKKHYDGDNINLPWDKWKVLVTVAETSNTAIELFFEDMMALRREWKEFRSVNSTMEFIKAVINNLDHTISTICL